MSFVRDGDLRYVGQGYELKTAIPEECSTPPRWPRPWAFHELTSANTAIASATTSSRSSTSGFPASAQCPRSSGLRRPGRQHRESPHPHRAVHLPHRRRAPAFETTFYRRHLLPMGESFMGPAIILQKDSTTVIRRAGARSTTRSAISSSSAKEKPNENHLQPSPRILASTPSPARSSRARSRTSPSRWATS